jgi:hypothetical protein
MTQANLIIPPPAPITFRAEGDLISPTYLNGPVFQAYRYSMALMFDALADTAALAVRARFPNLAPLDALQWLAQDRQIFQGPSETNAAYVARLIQWLDIWRHAGSSTGILLAYLSWLTPLAPQVLTVQSSAAGAGSSWDSYAAGSTPFPAGSSTPTPPIHQAVIPANWDWDGASQPYFNSWAYWRKWIIIQSSGSQAPWTAPTATWASGGTFSLTVVSDATYGTRYTNGGTAASASATSFNWGNGVTCWGWAGTYQQALQLTALAKSWKSAGVWVPWIIVSYNASWFQPGNAAGTDSPDGTWGYYAKIVSDATYGSRYVASRPSCATCTLIAGTADGQNKQPIGVG